MNYTLIMLLLLSFILISCDGVYKGEFVVKTGQFEGLIGHLTKIDGHGTACTLDNMYKVPCIFLKRLNE